MPNTNEITEIQTLDTARILDQEEKVWEKGWLRIYKRHKVVEFFAGESVSTTTKRSSWFSCAPYHEFQLLVDMKASGVSGNLLVEVILSDDRAKEYKLMDDQFGDLRWSGTGGDKKEAITGKCVSPYMMIRAVASAGTYVLSVKAVFVS